MVVAVEDRLIVEEGEEDLGVDNSELELFICACIEGNGKPIDFFLVETTLNFLARGTRKRL
jgi:hypothetical protein